MKREFPDFGENEVVVTPTGRRAQVVAHEGGGFYLVRYMDQWFGDDVTATIHRNLLARWQPGRARPIPVRIFA